MKTELTTEQSNHLIELGVPREKAKCELPIGDGEYVFRLDNLLEILPKEIKNGKYGLMIEFNNQYTFAYYYRPNEKLLGNKRRKELIDALYELTVFCLENNYIKIK